MKSAMLMLAASVALSAAMPSNAQPLKRADGPSFNCMKVPEAGIEELICRSVVISKLDRDLARVYAQRLAAASGPQRAILRDDQRNFIILRDLCQTSETDVNGCVTGSYRARIRVLTPVAAKPIGLPAPKGPSFKCTSAGNIVEKAICADRELSLLDRQLAEAYRKAEYAVPPPEVRRLRAEQLEWIRGRNRCAVRTFDRHSCIAFLYEARLPRLGDWINGTAWKTAE